MKERRTARVLLFDPAGRILLVQARDGYVQDPSGDRPPGSTFWFTPGGGLDADETVHAGARRELAEEAGIADVELGAAIWYGEQTLLLRGEPVLFKETFILARTAQVGLSDACWEDDERASLLGLHWWTTDALRTTAELIFPAVLKQRVTTLAALARASSFGEPHPLEHIALR